MAARFELKMLEEAQEFVLSLPKAAMKKVLDNVHRIAEGERNAVIFSTLIIATHGIIKKTQKTPKKEIAKAERIRQEYFNAKKR